MGRRKSTYSKIHWLTPFPSAGCCYRERGAFYAELFALSAGVKFLPFGGVDGYASYKFAVPKGSTAEVFDGFSSGLVIGSIAYTKASLNGMYVFDIGEAHAKGKWSGTTKNKFGISFSYASLYIGRSFAVVKPKTKCGCL